MVKPYCIAMRNVNNNGNGNLSELGNEPYMKRLMDYTDWERVVVGSPSYVMSRKPSIEKYIAE